ncbi:MAG: hypothetical protein ACLF0G_00085 [Candidatus Brocadiia bacterium]
MASATRADWASVGTGSCLRPLDAATEYLRERGWRVLPAYIVAMAPCSAVVLLLIDVVTGEQRSALPFACLLLTLAVLWRWGWLGAAQRRVQADLRGEPPLRLRRRLVAVLVARLAAAVVALWGAVLVVPAFFGFYISAIAAPILLERPGPAARQLRRALAWVSHASKRLMKTALVLVALSLVALLAVEVLQAAVVGLVLPGLLGLDTAALALTVRSWPWQMCLLYFLFVGFDLYWTVASVMVFYDLQARRLGTDLRLRLGLLREGGG